jgi:hypothetical protein
MYPNRDCVLFELVCRVNGREIIDGGSAHLPSIEFIDGSWSRNPVSSSLPTNRVNVSGGLDIEGDFRPHRS